MSSSSTLRDPNGLVKRNGDLLWALNNPTSLAILHILRSNDESDLVRIGQKLDIAECVLHPVLKRLCRPGLVVEDAGKYRISLRAKRYFERQMMTEATLLGRLITGQGESAGRRPLQGSYYIKEAIGRGATSITFCARQVSTHKDRTLKVFFPHTVTMEELDTALERRNSIHSECIPEVIDAGEIQIDLTDGSIATVSCVAMHYVDSSAQTLDKYLKSHANIDYVFLERFVEDVAGSLFDIENAGLQHGDLHEGNILVEPPTRPEQPPRFWVIDFVGVPSGVSQEIESISDIDSFRDHLLRASILACERSPGVSARLLLGQRVYRVLQALRQQSCESFVDMMEIYHKEEGDVPEDYFTKPAPSPFEWLRVEFIRDPSWLYQLFEPMEFWFDEIAKFGNICISGPRGCGKSHYLRVLAFQPEAIAMSQTDEALRAKLDEIGYDFRRLFGVLFTCRLGEFKAFAPQAMGGAFFDSETEDYLKHILILKIWNKTISVLTEGLTVEMPSNRQPLLSPPSVPDVLKLASFVSERLGNIAGIEASAGLALFRQIAAVCVARENSAVSVWHRPKDRGSGRQLNEQDLHDFFSVLRNCFGELNKAQFAILVDDATAGHMSFGYQRILNSLIRAAQHNHCFKVTHERYRYTLDSTDGRPVDSCNELEFVDLGESSVRSQKSRNKIAISKYLARVVNRRLGAAGYVADICKVLGRSQSVSKFLSLLAPPDKRTSRARSKDDFEMSIDSSATRALYAGWNIIWQLSHGSIRTLLEIIEEVYRDAKVKAGDIKVSPENQDMSVRKYSVRRFRRLSIDPGEIGGRPLGEVMQEVLAAIGEISWRYLTSYDTGTDERWYETISVDRNERGRLDTNAMAVLEALLKNDLLVAEGMNYSRSQVGLGTRYDLNKVFTPAFRTTYRVRNHMYVSNASFGELLDHPGHFVRRHVKKLGDLTTKPNRKSGQKGLFDD